MGDRFLDQLGALVNQKKHELAMDLIRLKSETEVKITINAIRNTLEGIQQLSAENFRPETQKKLGERLAQTLWKALPGYITTIELGTGSISRDTQFTHTGLHTPGVK